MFIKGGISVLLLECPGFIQPIVIHIREGQNTHLIEIVNSIHVKLEKFKRGRSPSLHLGKEGDFA